MDKKQIDKFREICAKYGCRKDYQIAEKMGIAPETFSRKIRGKAAWSVKEIKKAQDLFGLNSKTAAEFFL